MCTMKQDKYIFHHLNLKGCPLYRTLGRRLTPLPQCRFYASVNWVSIGSDNGLSPGRRQAIAWTNAGLLLNGPLGINFSEIWIKIQNFLFMKMHVKMSSAKWRPFCAGGNELKEWSRNIRQMNIHWQIQIWIQWNWCSILLLTQD